MPHAAGDCLIGDYRPRRFGRCVVSDTYRLTTSDQPRHREAMASRCALSISNPSRLMEKKSYAVRAACISPRRVWTFEASR